MSKRTYEELEVQIKQLEADNEKAMSVLKEANDAVLLAKSKFEALAAEVQAVRWACGQVYVRGYNHGHLNTADGLPYADEKDLVIRGGETLYEFTDPDHCGVAADAILAEVRAQGVEMLLDVYRSRWISPHVEDADRFAAQLRKGAAQ
ncbi:hypothetical protein PX343_06905 [Citrobacter koseri]|uniref:hypothetical protein n=1 Tax=Citrobacter koseri TaxID=545 RepID=UPI0023AB0BBE|nr:hypothetical protein [Citrobacter koseri]WEE18635.1 hypothetical protein PX343_06905 [Citrobacter koseri]